MGWTVKNNDNNNDNNNTIIIIIIILKQEDVYLAVKKKSLYVNISVSFLASLIICMIMKSFYSSRLSSL